MKHAVIIAHPNKNAFNAEIAATYCQAVESRGHSVLVRDLYEMNFDPCLKADEIPGPKGYAPREDVMLEHAKLKDADVFTFIYPLWLNAQPAILKGYLDRVFGMGFAYGRSGGANRPLLEGRKMLSFTSSGAPTEWVKKSGAWDALRTLFDEHLSALSGLDNLGHTHFGSIVPGIRKDVVERHRQTVRDVVAAHF